MPVNKDTYIPQYNNTVTISLGEANSQIFPVNPRYCLLPSSALELKEILDAEGLGPVSIEMRPPEVGFIRFNYSTLVPWFVYRDGATENAAFVAWNWIPNRTGIVALYYATFEVQGVMRDFETLGG